MACEDIDSVLADEPQQALPGKAEHHAFPVEKCCVNERLVVHCRLYNIEWQPMHAQGKNAKCVDWAQHEGSIPDEGFSASADFRNQFSARSTADHVIAGIDLSAKRFVVTDCNSDNGFQTMQALDANGPHTGDCRSGTALRLGSMAKISFADLASFMLSLVKRTNAQKQVISVAFERRRV